MAATPVDLAARKFAMGYEFLTQHKYQEARTAYEVGLRHNPTNAMAHFYLGEACRGLKAWACAETHYETSLEVDAKSSVASMAKQRERTAKVWRLLNEGKQALNDLNAPPTKIAQAADTLDIANKLGLDEEQQAFYRQLQERIHQRHARSNGQTVAEHQNWSM